MKKNKDIFIKELSCKWNLSLKKTRILVNYLSDYLSEELKINGELSLPKIGKFYVTDFSYKKLEKKLKYVGLNPLLL